MGAKLRAKLPDANGLTEELADKLAENPTYVPVVALLTVEDVTRHVSTGTLTTHMAILQMEPCAGPNAKHADDVHALLRSMHEERTGERSLFEGDAADQSTMPDGYSTGDRAEYDRQMDLLRRESAAALREKADSLPASKRKERDDLEAQADAFSSGDRDDEVRERLTATRPEFRSPEDSAEGGDI